MLSNGRDDTIWVFNAGTSFSGNPKWLFLYILKNRPDIKPYWLCYDKKLVNYMRKRGYQAFLFNSCQGKRIAKKAGIYVVNQVKEVFQEELKDVKILNLWHGVGCKTIEKKLNAGILNEKVAKKYICNNAIYVNNQMFLVTSSLMEIHFKKQCGIPDEKIIRAGYPCCSQEYKVTSYEHDILKIQGLSRNTKIIIYAPTFRENSYTDFFVKAIPDMERLIDVLEKNDLLLILKMHPFMEKDFYYNEVKKLYENKPNILFWDNQNDIYEIFSKVDIAIIDYSSIFYDMLACGVKSFIRYMFDIEDKNNVRDFVFDVKEMTCGYDCKSFEELLYVLDHIEIISNQTLLEERERIYELFWAYADKASNEDIINAIVNFKIEKKELPTLYSFDIFDTLLQRTTLLPKGVFYYVQDKILHEDFPNVIKKNYVRARMAAETNIRTRYKKTLEQRGDERLEITLDEIYDRLQEVYQLTDIQSIRLKQLELEGEYLAVMPYPEQIAILKDLVAHGEKVVLISDMYLPKDIVMKMLEKADPILSQIPLYLSSDFGVQKTTRKLFLKVYNDLDYIYGKWVHYGDNINADKKQPEMLGIHTVNHVVPKMNAYETEIIRQLNCYDGYVTAANITRNRVENQLDETGKEYFSYSYVSLCLVPYISWVLKHAISNEIKTLYFISRDGHHLKRIADTIIEVKGYPVKTKYIYGSRKAWRIPSFVNEVDAEFFSNFGNMVNVKTYDELLSAMSVSSDIFKKFFPEFAYLEKDDAAIEKMVKSIRERAKNSKAYKDYLLKCAAEERPIVIQYLQQEINFAESFAFVEYWGRGYTQECLTRLLYVAAGAKIKNPFYYARSIYGTVDDNIRYNFTTNNGSLIFVEAIFANMPYKSVSKYENVDGIVRPVIEDCDNDKELHIALEKNLVKFARQLYSQILIDEDNLERKLFDFAMDYYRDHADKALLVNNVAHLKDSVEQYGKLLEFAPEITFSTIVSRVLGKKYFETKSKKMSLGRSKMIYRNIFIWYKDYFKKTKCFNVLKKVKRKFSDR